MLYKFLKENCIMDKYIANIQKAKPNFPKNTKSILWNAVETYMTSGYEDNFSNLFNYAPGSFFWDCSKEGVDFWQHIHTKWVTFRLTYINTHKEEKLQ